MLAHFFVLMLKFLHHLAPAYLFFAALCNFLGLCLEFANLVFKDL